MGRTRYSPRAAKSAGSKRRFGDVEPRFVWIGKQRAALRLEHAFWAALETMAVNRGLGVEELLRDIVPPPVPRNFTERVRIAILTHYWRVDESNDPRLA
jgi:predicted DNA-binding ribbon-helix-helix protein